MKSWFPLFVLALASVVALHAETVQEVYARGVRAYIGGDTDMAKVLFAQVIAADPGNQSAAAYMRRIELLSASNADLKKRTEKLMVSKVDFHDASLNSVLDWLPKLAAQQKATLNIVRLFPKPYGDEKQITLQLTNIPMSNVLDYVSQLGGLKLDYQKNAIVLSMADKAEPATQQ